MACPDLSGSAAQRARAIVAVLLGCALRRPDVAALARWALFGRIHAGGGVRRTARDYGGTEGVLPAISDRFFARLAGPGRGGAWRVVRPRRVRHARANSFAIGLG